MYNVIAMCATAISSLIKQYSRFLRETGWNLITDNFVFLRLIFACSVTLYFSVLFSTRKVSTRGH